MWYWNFHKLEPRSRRLSLIIPRNVYENTQIESKIAGKVARILSKKNKTKRKHIQKSCVEDYKHNNLSNINPSCYNVLLHAWILNQTPQSLPELGIVFSRQHYVKKFDFRIQSQYMFFQRGNENSNFFEVKSRYLYDKCSYIFNNLGDTSSILNSTLSSFELKEKPLLQFISEIA